MKEVLALREVTKVFHQKVAVSRVSFSLHQGEIFGLLGPNGAGKTTLIRMIMGIFYPDEGEIFLFEKPFSANLRKRIGYLPEERGLYLKQKVLDLLVYFGQLKGLSKKEALLECTNYLERFGLSESSYLTAESLSKGMQQKVQLIVSLLGNPQLLILDEPFSGLDPVNIRMVKNLLQEFKDRGIPILLSSHQMNFVEEVCDQVLLIDHGKPLLNGPLRDIKGKHSEHAVVVEAQGSLENLSSIEEIQPLGDRKKILLKAQSSPQTFLKELVEVAEVHSFEIYETPLEEIFVNLVSGGREKEK